MSATDSARELPNGRSVDGALWLRVRARLLDELDGPGLTDGKLADAADAACVGFVEHSEFFSAEFSRWYARRVIQAMEGATPEELIHQALVVLGEDGHTPTTVELDGMASLLAEALERLGTTA